MHKTGKSQSTIGKQLGEKRLVLETIIRNWITGNIHRSACKISLCGVQMILRLVRKNPVLHRGVNDMKRAGTTGTKVSISNTLCHDGFKSCSLPAYASTCSHPSSAVNYCAVNV